MATQSFFEDLNIDTEEKARRLEEAFESANAPCSTVSKECSEALSRGMEFLRRNRATCKK